MKTETVNLRTEIEARLIRFDDLVPCKTAFIDAKTPGSDKKENFCLIGGGVAENPDQHVHINIPHGFDIGAARQPHGCKNSHHSHDTEEVFFVHNGEWKFSWGESGEDGEAVLTTGDTISIPTHVFRGFENVGPDDGFLFAVLGQNRDGSAGHVTWAPYVFDQAKRYGLVLLEDGRLIDTSIGLKIPDDARELNPPGEAELARFLTLDLSAMEKCVARSDQPLAQGGLGSLNNVTEQAVLGTGNPAENIDSGRMGWEHGFQVRKLTLSPAAQVPTHTRTEEEVLFVHQGQLKITMPSATVVLNEGDLFSVPVGMKRAFTAADDLTTQVVVVRRGDHPTAAKFQ